jgi:hypothetical protein
VEFDWAGTANVCGGPIVLRNSQNTKTYSYMDEYRKEEHDGKGNNGKHKCYKSMRSSKLDETQKAPAREKQTEA